jgi:transposase
MTIGEAVRRGQLVDNACRHVPGLPEERRELDYLRLDEIERYLEACGDFYRPLAEFLIGTGARISEALAVRWPDADLETGIVRISRQRARTTLATVATKGKRFRSVQIGPRLVATLEQLRDERAATRRDDGGWLFLCPPPLRGRYSRRTKPVPPNRRTAHDWHEWALEDAGLRNMPLHALRHTAATAWLGIPPFLRSPDGLRRKSPLRRRTPMPKTRPAYPEQFRREALELVRQGRAIPDVAESLRVSQQTLRNWRRQAERDRGKRDDGLTSAERDELRELRRRVKRLEQERDILKRATALFARETETR